MVGQKGRISDNGGPAKSVRRVAPGFPTLRQTAHDLANHLLAIELRVQELLADPPCMSAQPETIRTLERLSLDAAASLKDLQAAIVLEPPRAGSASSSRPRPKKRA
jgi:hypothetical protein